MGQKDDKSLNQFQSIKLLKEQKIKPLSGKIVASKRVQNSYLNNCYTLNNIQIKLQNDEILSDYGNKNDLTLVNNSSGINSGGVNTLSGGNKQS